MKSICAKLNDNLCAELYGLGKLDSTVVPDNEIMDVIVKGTIVRGNVVYKA